MNDELRLDIYCTKCEKVTSHHGRSDDNGEHVFECHDQMDKVKRNVVRDGEEVEIEEEIPHHFVKFPADTTEEQFAELLDKHEEHNKGLISVEKQQEKLKNLIQSVSLRNANSQGAEESVASENQTEAKTE